MSIPTAKNKTKLADHAKSLIAKADEGYDSHDAMRFSQAAVNVTNALMNLRSINIRMDE